MNDTINQIQEKNRALRQRLTTLMDEDIDDPTDVRFVWSMNDLEGSTRQTSEKVGNQKEPKYKWESFKESVNQIKNKQYELPKKLVTEHREETIIDDLSDLSDDSVDEVTSTRDTFANKLKSQNDLIKQLQFQLQVKDTERRDIIEEFQLKEMELIRSTQSKQAELKRTLEEEHRKKLREVSHQLNEERERSRTLNQMLVKAQSLEAERGLDHDKQQKNQAKHEVINAKLTGKLLIFKRLIDELQDKNERLVEINRFISKEASHANQRPRPSTEEAANNLDFDNTIIHTHDLLGSVEDSTTEFLIRGASNMEWQSPEKLSKGANRVNNRYSGLTERFAFGSANPCSPQIATLWRRAILSVLFINRTRRLVHKRRTLDARIQEIMH